MLTLTQAAQIVTDRRLVLRFVDGGWIAETAQGGRTHRGIKPTYEESVEAADSALRIQESSALQSRKHVIYTALESGEYWIRPRMIELPGETGPVTERVFDVMRQNSAGVNETLVLAERSYAAAGVRAVEIHGAAPAPARAKGVR